MQPITIFNLLERNKIRSLQQKRVEEALNERRMPEASLLFVKQIIWNKFCKNISSSNSEKLVCLKTKNKNVAKRTRFIEKKQSIIFIQIKTIFIIRINTRKRGLIKTLELLHKALLSKGNRVFLMQNKSYLFLN